MNDPEDVQEPPSDTGEGQESDDAAQRQLAAKLIKELSSRGHLDLADLGEVLKSIGGVVASGVAGNLAYDAAKTGVSRLRDAVEPDEDTPPARHARNP